MIRPAGLAAYIAGAFTRNTLAFLVGLISLILVIDVVGESTRITAVAGAGAPELFAYAVLRLPVLIAQLAPFIVLLGALTTTVMLAYTSQVAAMQASGLSVHQLVRPMAAVGLLCAGLHFALNELVAVDAAESLGAWQATGYGASSAPPRDQDVWIDTGTAIVHAAAAIADGDKLRLEDVTLFRQSEAGSVTAVATADHAVLAGPAGTLVNVKETDLSSNQARAAEAEAWHPGISLSRVLNEPIDPRHLSVVELFRALPAARAAGDVPSAVATEIHHRFSWPLACAVMPLFAGLAAYSLARAGSVLPRAGLGFLLGFFYFVADSFSGAMARSGALPPFLAAWLPLLLFLVIAEMFLLRLSSPGVSRAAHGA